MTDTPLATGRRACPGRADLAGRLDEHVIDSGALAGNPLGDPARRPLLVYVPPGYDDEPDRRYPSVYVLHGFTGHLAMWRNRSPFRQPFVETADAAVASGACPPVIVVYVDAWTALGGSQFVDSPGTGRYHTYLCEDVVGWVDARYRTLDDPGTGAWPASRAAATAPWSPPCGGPTCSAASPPMPATPCSRRATSLVPRRGPGPAGRVPGLLRAVLGRLPVPGAAVAESDGELVEIWAYAAAFSASEDGTVRLPFDTATAALVPEVWERWLAVDPVRVAAERRAAAAGLRAVWIDAGNHDEYFLDLGATAFRARCWPPGCRASGCASSCSPPATGDRLPLPAGAGLAGRAAGALTAAGRARAGTEIRARPLRSWSVARVGQTLVGSSLVGLMPPVLTTTTSISMNSG